MFRLLLLLLFPLALCAQSDSVQQHSDSLFQRSEPRFTAQADALFFMADNEFDSHVQRGYTLPGLWLRPSLAYRPHPQVRFEGGLHALLYYGADKYPSYAYHDLPHWRGSQNQRGAHLLPLLRADLHWPHAQLTLGDLYGHTLHDLALPLYNPQALLSTDPERGVQLRLHRSHYRLDTWIDWQSFIFDGSDHQEVFVAGLSQRLQLLPPTRAHWQLSLPLQVLAQHRGGEQDRPDHGVQTLLNAALGLELQHHRPHRRLRQVRAQLLALASYQEAGKLWPFDTGAALWGQVATHWQLAPQSQLHASLGLFHAPQRFANLLGSPFFGTLSLKEPGSTFARTTTAHWQVECLRNFGPDIQLALRALGYVLPATQLRSPEGQVQPAPAISPFTFALTLRWQPRWHLSRAPHASKAKARFARQSPQPNPF